MITLRPTDAVPASPLLERYLSSANDQGPDQGPDQGSEGAEIAARLGGPPTMSSVRELAKRLAEGTESRMGATPAPARGEAMVASLLSAHEPLDPDEATIRSIRALGDPKTLVVATGQQPGLLTGPLYSVLKAASAIAAARRLEKELGVTVVPVYWVASDDHDLPEVEGCFTVAGDGAVHRHRVDLERIGWPSSHLTVPASADEVVQRFLEDVPGGEHRDAVLELAKARPGEPWARWFSRVLLSLLPDQGLVLFEPSLHPELMMPWIRSHITGAAMVPSSLRAGKDRLLSLGLASPLPVDRASGLFVFDGERRRRFDPAEVDSIEEALGERPLALTADAALRPVIQSSVLPVVAVVGGPGELAYWLQLTELFEAAEIPRPVFLPRLSATLIEPRVRRALDGLGLDEESLVVSPLPLDISDDSGLDEPVVADGRAKAEEARLALDAFLSALDGVGGPVPGKARDLKKVFGASLDRILDLAGRHLREQAGISRKRVGLVQGSGRPQGKTQDRVLNALPFLSRGGIDLFARIAESIDPFDFRHSLLTVEPVR